MQGSIPVALLQRWYSLVREKRAPRQDFLKALVKVFQENQDYKASQVSLPSFDVTEAVYNDPLTV